MSKIKQFLEQNLTKADYDLLPEQLNISHYRLDNFLQEPSRFRLEHIKTLSKITNLSGSKLVFDYNLGLKHLTGLELQKIAIESGGRIGVIKTAA